MKKQLTASAFMALSDAEKDAMAAEVEHLTPRQRQGRPLNAGERAEWRQIRKAMGRPKLGRDGVGRMSVSIEKGLLAKADQFARAHGLGRSQLVARALQDLLPKAG